MLETPTKPRERREHGRSLREQAPLESHADWSSDPQRDPVALIEEQNEARIGWLVPVRRARMSVSPFTFYRGAARIMAHDLSQSPTSGLTTQICGDAHIANFGVYASPERRLVFDLNDFDEALPGPWEWDVKRLAASFFIACRHNELDKADARRITGMVARQYRKAMARLAEMKVGKVWYNLVEADHITRSIKDPQQRAAAEAAFTHAKSKDSKQALRKLATKIDGEHRIQAQPPLIIPLRNLPDQALRNELHEVLLQSFEDYKKTVPDEVEHLIQKYRLKDIAVKVVGVGSVGTRCFILLLKGRDRKDPLFLQVKEATRSVLEEHLPQSRYQKSGRRVVEGQRLLQTVSDIFLGWTETDLGGHHYYVRQLKDWKGSDDVDDMSRSQLELGARTRGWTLARAHARSGDPIAISGYLGGKEDETFDEAITAFAERYAKQNRQDYDAFKARIDVGELAAAELE